MAPTFPPTSAPNAVNWMSGQPEIRGRTMAEVWRDWHGAPHDVWVGPAEITALVTVILCGLGLLFLMWLNLPLVHRTGPVWPSVLRTLRATAPIVWPATMATAVVGAAFIVREHANMRGGNTLGSGLLIEPGLLVLGGISLFVPLLLLWLSRAVRTAAPVDSILSLPPRCEGCGYDLTHQPAEGRCSECGLALEESLVEGLSRPHSGWARERDRVSWVAAWTDVLLRPYEFYRRLQLRRPMSAAIRFAAWNYVLIPCAALAWAATMVVVLSLRHTPPPDLLEIVLVLGAAVLLGTVGCWLGHRTIQALVTTWCLIRSALPDFRWAAQVGAYETAYLWVFCGFWGTLYTSMVLFDCWLTALMGGSRWGPPITEMFVTLWGTLALGAVWVWRYFIAYRAIRWSNF